MTRPFPDTDFHRLICSLNDEYRLGILRPSYSSVGTKKPQHDEACDIYERLRVLYDRRRASGPLGRFRLLAQDLSRTRLAKPQGDPDLLPELSAPHGVQFDQERADLRHCLLSLLDAALLKPTKRLTDDTFDQPPSRPKSKPRFVGPADDALDAIPVRSKELIEGTLDQYQPSLSGLQERPNVNSFSRNSADTSRVSVVSNVFSTQGRENTPATSQGTEYVSLGSGKRVSSSSFHLLGDDDVTTGSILTRSSGAWNETLSDDNDMIQDASSDYTIAPTSPNDRPLPRSWSQSTSGFSDDITSEDYDSIFNPPLQSLHKAWPHFASPYLVEAPLAVVWEVTRAALHCGVDLKAFDLTYDPNDTKEWHDQDRLRNKLSMHRLFQNKMLPERCDNTTWGAALSGFRHRDKVVVLSAELSYNSKDSEPLYKLSLKPMRLQLGHRLDRRFGPDRFLEITLPSPEQSSQQPKRLRSWEDGSESIIRWLCDGVHALLGRQWKPFFTKPAKKIKKAVTYKDANEKDVTIFQEQIFFLAVDGHHFRPPSKPGTLPSHNEAESLDCRTKINLDDFLKWVINPGGSGDQSTMKLFSRLSLSLTRTYATVVLHPSQIIHRRKDLLSTPEQNVMNDGMGRMSYGLAKQVAQHLDLDYTPSAFQGRLGSAKGMWIRDVKSDDPAAIWIETYPSQRKFECPFIDVHHRIFEVKAFTKSLKPASLNRQFIPILEAQAKLPHEKVIMRQRLETHLENTIRGEVAVHLSALEHPAETLMFVRQLRTGNAATDRVEAFLGGAPKSDADLASFLIASGFEPKKSTLLDSTLWKIWESRIKSVKEKWNAEVPCSTHVYMGIDFTGVLKPGEVHLSFSSDFTVEGFSDTQLEGIDVLVARAPAHFPSDIQKVRAVSKPELRKLKDIILFPQTGSRPLADLLSGGDYDGDRAWVCWDPDIVKNFSNAAAPGQPHDFLNMGYLRKRHETFNDIKASYGKTTCNVFVLSGMSFSMQPSLLGICTKFKEKLCYYQSVDSEGALLLCDLVSNLVDQAKGGIEFNDDDWGRFCQELLGVPKFAYEQPEYEKEMSSAWRRRRLPHILDYLKFEVANNVIAECSTKLSAALSSTRKGHTDEALTAMYRFYFNLGKHSNSIRKMMAALEKALSDLRQEWNRLADLSASDNWEARVQHLHSLWVNISPPEDLKSAAKIRELNDPWATDGLWSAPFSRWSELKASATFFNNYKSPTFAFRMAGRQLARMKSTALDNAADPGQASAVFVRPTLWAVQKPDKKAVARLLRRRVEANEKVAALDEVTSYDDDGTVLDD